MLFSRCKNKLSAAIHALDDTILKIWHCYRSRSPTQATPGLARSEPHGAEIYSISLRLFFLFRLRANACLARFFSPGFK